MTTKPIKYQSRSVLSDLTMLNNPIVLPTVAIS